MSSPTTSEQTSLFRETWKEMNAAKKVLLPWLIGCYAAEIVLFIIIFLGALTLGGGLEMFSQIRQDPHLLKQHSEMMPSILHKMMIMMAIVIPIFIIILMVKVYVLMITYLRFAIKQSPPAYSVNGFFYWLGKVLWSNIRPMVWLLIPIIGVFFYIPSAIGYSLVSPLAALRRGPELQRSRDLVKGHKWRIFWNGLGIFATLFMVSYGPSLTFTIFNLHNAAVSIIAFVVQIAGAFGFSMASVIYPCTVYRVLLKEKKTSVPSAPVSANLTPAT